MANHIFSAIFSLKIKEAFEFYIARFKEITLKAKSRFEKRDWKGMQADMEERLDLYKTVVDELVRDLKKSGETITRDSGLWKEIKENYSELVHGRRDYELALTFFNSASRRVLTTVGVNPDAEYTSLHQPPRHNHEFASLIKNDARRYRVKELDESLIKKILGSCGFGVPFENMGRDCLMASKEIRTHLGNRKGPGPEQFSVEVLNSVFFRNKGAYVVGRICGGGAVIPLLFCLLNLDKGIRVDAVLMTSDETSVVFSFTRSYFHVDSECPAEIIDFLKTVMPLKPISELYSSIGFNRHGKTELYWDLNKHLEMSRDQFGFAPGEKGMVMSVFTLPSFDVVFKVIRDTFNYPKTTTKEKVMDRYRLVFKHDRAGRLVDAQEFEYMQFQRERFSPDLLEELLRVAPGNVFEDSGHVVIRHLYTERKLTPLNIYLKEADFEKAGEAVTDYGYAIKDLAASNIFPGDILLKNFGVTRHGRVVFYDYDELCLLTECQVRGIPQSDALDDEMEAEPWFYVRENDIFPEEFKTFLGLGGPLKEIFINLHKDLFTVKYWSDMRKRLLNGEITDLFPYKLSKRFGRF